MDNYAVYVAVAAATIALPGPAVMLTINNSVQRGLLKSLAGISGIALAILLVAIISATSLGIILASSALAFTAVKIIIQTLYALFVSLAKSKLTSPGNRRLLNKISGGVFVGFGVGLAASGK